MDLRYAAKAKTPETKQFLDNLAKDNTYVKNGLVFRKNEDGTLDALGPLSKNTPERCLECLFWTKKPGKVFTVDGEVEIVGCIRTSCIDKPKDTFILTAGIHPHVVSDKGKQMLKSAWKENQK